MPRRKRLTLFGTPTSNRPRIRKCRHLVAAQAQVLDEWVCVLKCAKGTSWRGANEQKPGKKRSKKQRLIRKSFDPIQSSQPTPVTLDTYRRFRGQANGSSGLCLLRTTNDVGHTAMGFGSKEIILQFAMGFVVIVCGCGVRRAFSDPLRDFLGLRTQPSPAFDHIQVPRQVFAHASRFVLG